MSFIVLGAVTFCCRTSPPTAFPHSTEVQVTLLTQHVGRRSTSRHNHEFSHFVVWVFRILSLQLRWMTNTLD